MKQMEPMNEMEYAVTQHNATEPAFSGKYWDFDEPGIYVDPADGTPLFTSRDKFASSCGWPAFSKPIKGAVVYEEDYSHGMHRVEVRSTRANSHLGHVFQDNPNTEDHLRYCINSAAMRFIPKDKMEEMGYGDYLKLID